MKSVKTVGIVGNPNVGKTYLFNQLTACQGCVGNWSGVTQTACKAKSFGNHEHMILDLPGCHALKEYDQESEKAQHPSELEKIIKAKKVDLWLNVLDVQNLEKQLYLTVQLLEARQNMIVVINRIDLLPVIKKNIDIQALAGFLMVPVVKVSAKLGLGIKALQTTIAQRLSSQINRSNHTYPVKYDTATEALLEEKSVDKSQSRFDVWGQLVQGDHLASPPAWHFDVNIAKQLTVHGSMTDLMALTRYQAISRWCSHVVSQQGEARRDQDKCFDAWFLHKWLGLPIFFMMMFTVFWLSMGFGQLLQGLFEPFLRLLTIQIPAWLCQSYQMPFYIEVMITQGIGLSVVTALSFFPILFVMFFALHILEESGYMTRAAVVMDRLMRYCNLPGESLVALVLGLGCNVPGILATRHIPNDGDKVVTALMMPFMSCGARLTIFAVFSSVFFPHQAASVLMLLYVLGISVAVFTGVVARYIGGFEKSEAETYLLELPAYQWPLLPVAIRQAYNRSKRFVWRALGVIMPVCAVLAICNHISITGALLDTPGDQSILAYIGKCLSGLFYPIGLERHHWPLVVSLLMGLLAKEVVISTLSIFYMQMGANALESGQSFIGLWQACGSEIAENIGHWYTYFMPFMQVETPGWAPYFNQQHISTEAVMGYLIFTLLYFPCVSTLYATARQVGWKWAGVSVLWSTAAAYLCASAYIMAQKLPWVVWEIGALIGVLLLTYSVKELIKKQLALKARKKHASAT